MPPFESTTQHRFKGWYDFRVGTCHGLWRSTGDAYEILAVVNHQKGNGHFKAAMWWFEQSCRRDKKKLRLMECWNVWLIWQSQKLGYTRVPGTWLCYEKTFTQTDSRKSNDELQS